MGLTALKIAGAVFGVINEFVLGVKRRDYIRADFVDFSGAMESREYELNHGIADMIVSTAINSVAFSNLQPIWDSSSAGIRRVRFVIQIAEYDFDCSEVATNSNVNECGKLFFETETGHARSIEIPSIKDEVLLAGGKDKIDLSNSLVVNAVQCVKDYLLSDNLELSVLKAAKRVTYSNWQ